MSTALRPVYTGETVFSFDQITGHGPALLGSPGDPNFAAEFSTKSIRIEWMNAMVFNNPGEGEPCTVQLPGKFLLRLPHIIFAEWSENPSMVPVHILQSLADERHNMEIGP